MSMLDDIKMLITAGYSKDEINTLLNFETENIKDEKENEESVKNKDKDINKDVDEKPNDNQILNIMQKYNIRTVGKETPKQYNQEEALASRYTMLIGGENKEEK